MIYERKIWGNGRSFCCTVQYVRLYFGAKMYRGPNIYCWDLPPPPSADKARTNMYEYLPVIFFPCSFLSSRQWQLEVLCTYVSHKPSGRSGANSSENTKNMVFFIYSYSMSPNE
jgi:hypothetical protein